MDVYENARVSQTMRSLVESGPYVSEGCFADVKGSRIMDTLFTQEPMSAEVSALVSHSDGILAEKVSCTASPAAKLDLALRAGTRHAGDAFSARHDLHNHAIS